MDAFGQLATFWAVDRAFGYSGQLHSDLTTRQMRIIQETRLVEGDTAVFHYMVNNQAFKKNDRIEIYYISNNSETISFYLGLDRNSFEFTAREKGHRGYRMPKRGVKMHSRESPPNHQCSFHIRALPTRYQVFYDRQYVGRFSGYYIYLLQFMVFDKVESIVFATSYKGSIEVNSRLSSGARKNEYFLDSNYKVHYGRIPQVLRARQEFLLQAFSGDRNLYYWNNRFEQQKKPTAIFTMRDIHGFTNLQIVINWVKGTVEITQPIKMSCGIFRYVADYLIDIKVKIQRDQFEVEVDQAHCEVVHASDPYDICEFETDGNIEPVRYVVYDM
ncbi:hypothetical protein Tcan_10470 [Toxocara canis]|uniref:Galectin n=1 Tax=Toxocara canis TaxID=6265 RepID=A0A0B2V6I4_TOXCA|nr:hypothetical protein Tcan_10470 [Toxocara canis]